MEKDGNIHQMTWIAIFGKNESFLNDWGDFVGKCICIENKNNNNKKKAWTILLGVERFGKNMHVHTYN